MTIFAHYFGNLVVDMKLIDITGPIYPGMWAYEPPYPELEYVEIPQPPWVKTQVYASEVRGLCTQTGTYLETSAHINPDGPCLDQVELRDLFQRDTVIINLPARTKARQPILREELEASLGDFAIKPGLAIIVGTGWGQYWKEDFYLSDAPYFTSEAMSWLLAKVPFLLGADSPRWDHLEKPQGFWEKLFASGTLLLAPVVNIEQIKVKTCKLVVLPLKLSSICAAPARAVLVIE